MTDGVTITTRGDRELTLRFESFPSHLHDKLLARIGGLTEQLQARVVAATPHLTGTLQSEETERVFGDSPERVAGYVGVYAPSDPAKEYPKAATLEYGTNKPRRAFQKRAGLMAALLGPRLRIIGKLSKAVHIEPVRYLRDSLDEMQPEVIAAFQEVLNEAIADDNS